MAIDYVRTAMHKHVADTEDLHLEEQAVMYMVWLIVPYSAEIGRQLSMRIRKKVKMEMKKAATDIQRFCNQLDIMMAGENGGTEVLEIYDDMLTAFRKEIKIQEENIIDCAREYYDGKKDRDDLAEIAFCYSVTKCHAAIARFSDERLRRIHSLLTFENTKKNLCQLQNLFAKLGRLYEKKNGIAEEDTIFHFYAERDDTELDITGMVDVIRDYYDRLLNDVDMHARIQIPLARFNKTQDDKAKAIGEDIVEMPIDVLGITSDVFTRNNIKIIRDLYCDNGFKALDWSEKEKEKIIAALQEFIKKEALKYA